MTAASRRCEVVACGVWFGCGVKQCRHLSLVSINKHHCGLPYLMHARYSGERPSTSVAKTSVRSPTLRPSPRAGPSTGGVTPAPAPAAEMAAAAAVAACRRCRRRRRRRRVPPTDVRGVSGTVSSPAPGCVVLPVSSSAAPLPSPCAQPSKCAACMVCRSVYFGNSSGCLPNSSATMRTEPAAMA